MSDSSQSSACDSVIADFSLQHPGIRTVHVRSDRRALPWHRSWAFRHSTGSVVLFLDDDIALTFPALAALERAYLEFPEENAIAGVGFLLVYEDGGTRNPHSGRERWLGTANLSHGSITPGGLTVTLTGLNVADLTEVSALSGGCMSFRRGVLEKVFELDNLVALYESGIGRGEDAVLSCYARKLGRLFVLPVPYACHALANPNAPTPYAASGWRRGLTQTYGRAHTMRWMATDWRHYKHDWWRMVTLELARSGLGILRRPWASERWLKFGGVCYGIALTLVRWKRIPENGRSADAPVVSASTLHA